MKMCLAQKGNGLVDNMAMCDMGVANLQVFHHNTVIVNGPTTRKSPWEYHWLNILQLVIPVLVTINQQRSVLESKLRTKHIMQPCSGVPGYGICHLTAADTYTA
jgi:hypothetical protein